MSNPENSTFLMARHSKKTPDLQKEYPGISIEGEELVREKTREHLLKIIEESDPGSVVMFLGSSDLPRTKSTSHISANEVKNLLGEKTDKYLVYEQKDIEGMVDKKTQSTREMLSKVVAENPDKKIVLSYPLFLKEFSMIVPESGIHAGNPDWKTGGTKEISTPYLTELIKQSENKEAVAVTKWIENMGEIKMPDGTILRGPNPVETAQGYIKSMERLQKFAKNLFPNRPLVIEVSTHSWDIDAFIAYATHQGKLDVAGFREIARGADNKDLSIISEFEFPVIKIDENTKTLSYRGKEYELNSPEFVE